VLSVLTPIWDEVPTAASNLRGRIESVLDWATAHGYREGPNPARWKGHLKHLLANPRTKEKKHHPALPIEQMGEFMRELRRRPGMAFRALELAILCASRSGEVLEADWKEFDLQAGTWTIPGARMKVGKDQRVALSKAAIELLRTMPTSNCPVFPGKSKEGLLTQNALYRALEQMNRPEVKWKDRDGEAITVHGFRTSFRTWGGERTNFPREVIEQCLAHVVASAVELAYLRTDALEKRRKVMEAWAGFRARLEAKGNVVALAARLVRRRDGWFVDTRGVRSNCG